MKANFFKLLKRGWKTVAGIALAGVGLSIVIESEYNRGAGDVAGMADAICKDHKKFIELGGKEEDYTDQQARAVAEKWMEDTYC